MNKLFLFLFLLLLIPIVSSAPPSSQTNVNIEVGIEIEYLHIGTQPANQNLSISAHVFNISNGLRLRNDTTDCWVHLLDNQGGHLLNKTAMAYDDNNEAFHYTIEEGNFTRLGMYNPLLICNATSIGGFTSYAFEINQGGIELTEGMAIIYVGIFFILIFFLIANVFVINLLPARNESDEEGRILSVSYLKYFRNVGWLFEYLLMMAIFYLSSNVAYAYLQEQLFATFLLMLFKISLAILPIILTLWLIWIFVQMFHDKQFQDMLNKGVFPQGRNF